MNEKLSRLSAPNDAVLRTSALTGNIDLQGGAFVVSIDLHRLRSDQSRRDDYVRREMFPRQPIATIAFAPITSVPDGLLEGREVSTAVTGRVNVNGIEADLVFEINARLDGDTLHVLGVSDFVWADFGMQAPRSRLFTVKDEVHVEVLLAAKRNAG